MPDSARFCFVSVFRPATGVQTPHTEIHTAPRPFFLPLSVTVCPSTGRSRYFHPSNRTCDEAPVIVTKKPILSPIPRRIPIPLVPISRHDSRDARDIHRPCKRYSIFRLAASRMLNTKATLLHVCIYIYIYVSSERRKEFREREHWLNRALTHRQIAIRKSSRLRS